MMLLLVIFMITAPMMQGGVDVALPKAEARPLEPKSGLVVTVDRAGRIFVDETRMSLAEFRAAFRALAGKRAARRRVSARRRGRAVRRRDAGARDHARGGVGDVGLVTDPEIGEVSTLAPRAATLALRAPLVVSALLHCSSSRRVVARARARAARAVPPMYRVNLVAAPPGPRADRRRAAERRPSRRRRPRRRRRRRAREPRRSRSA